MVYIFKDRLIRVEWTIYKGISPVKEDFSRSNVKVFLLGNREKYLLQARADKGTLYVDIPSGLEEGTYSIDTVLSFKTIPIILVILRKTIIFAHSDA